MLIEQLKKDAVMFVGQYNSRPDKDTPIGEDNFMTQHFKRALRNEDSDTVRVANEILLVAMYSVSEGIPYNLL